MFWIFSYAGLKAHKICYKIQETACHQKNSPSKGTLLKPKFLKRVILQRKMGLFAQVQFQRSALWRRIFLVTCGFLYLVANFMGFQASIWKNSKHPLRGRKNFLTEKTPFSVVKWVPSSLWCRRVGTQLLWQIFSISNEKLMWIFSDFSDCLFPPNLSIKKVAL